MGTTGAALDAEVLAMSNQLMESDPFTHSSYQDLAATPRAGMESHVNRDMPSEPLLGRLPLARLIPQDIHSMMDYGNALTVGAGIAAVDPRAKIASIMLAASGAGVAMLTDYRLSLAKIIPIETHEAIDHIWGLSAIVAPFVLGYWKTSPKVALSHVVTGAATILASLVTDYRAYRGVGRRRRAFAG